MYGRTETSAIQLKRNQKRAQGGVASDELDQSTTTRVTEDTYFISSHAACQAWETQIDKRHGAHLRGMVAIGWARWRG